MSVYERIVSYCDHIFESFSTFWRPLFGSIRVVKPMATVPYTPQQTSLKKGLFVPPGNDEGKLHRSPMEMGADFSSSIR